jgi:hypothetical protein
MNTEERIHEAMTKTNLNLVFLNRRPNIMPIRKRKAKETKKNKNCSEEENQKEEKICKM